LLRRDYVRFEFLQKSKRYTRHVLAIATVANGKLILFTTGANERRWSRMEGKLLTSLQSFKAFNVYA
jgi:PsbP